jgi:predicted amidohydrolase
MPQYAESIPDGSTSRRWAGLAKELGVWLLGGSMIEPVEGQPGKLYNTAVLFSDSGTYRTAHCLHIHPKNKLGRYHHHVVLTRLLASTCYVYASS